jgi:hypothetical protein
MKRRRLAIGVTAILHTWSQTLTDHLHADGVVQFRIR